MSQNNDDPTGYQRYRSNAYPTTNASDRYSGIGSNVNVLQTDELKGRNGIRYPIESIQSSKNSIPGRLRVGHLKQNYSVGQQ